MTFDVERLRESEFAWMNAGSTVYMNSASTGPSPRRSIDAQVDYVTRRATPHLVDFDDQFGILDTCRERIARMINAGTDEIAVATNTGAGINLAAWGYPLGRGDVVIVPEAEFPANMYPWLAASRSRGFEVQRIPMDNGLFDENAFIDALDRPKVKVASVSWAGFSTGFVADLDRIGRACRSREILFVVDAIQALGPARLDVAKTPIDVLACGGQKWLLSPWGSGFTYVRRDLMPWIVPQPVSWMGVRGADDFTKLIDYELRWRDNARRYEQVTLAYQDFAGMAASLALLEELGFDAVARHAHRCALALLDGASERAIKCVTPRHRCAGIAAVRPADAVASSAQLTSHGVIHSLREGVIRLAPHCYTTASDIERTLMALLSDD